MIIIVHRRTYPRVMRAIIVMQKVTAIISITFRNIRICPIVVGSYLLISRRMF